MEHGTEVGAGSAKIHNITFILATGFREGSPFPPF